MANLCKFDKKQYQVSYDSGVTWENVIPEQIDRGDNMIEYDSQDCSSVDTMYRWRTLDGQYLCDGKEKWTKQIQEDSYNNGLTWYASYPTVYRKGTYVGIDEAFCNDKFVGHYEYDPSNCGGGGGGGGGGNPQFCPGKKKWNGYSCVFLDPLKVVKCDGDAIANENVQYYNNQCGYHLISAEIGDCVRTIGNYAFSNCSELKSIGVVGSGASVEIPSGVTTFDFGAFAGCSGLTSVTIPATVTNINYRAFYNCTGLTSITVLSSTPPNLEVAAFDGTSNCPIFVPCESKYIYMSLWSDYASRIEAIPPCEPTVKFTSTYNNSTSYSGECNGTTVLSSGETRPSGYDISTMTSAEIINCTDTIGDGVFSGCTSLSSITIPNSVTSIGLWAFYKCSDLTSVTIPSGVTSIGSSAFYECSGLTSITIPNSLRSIGNGVFENCTSLSSVTIGSGVTSIGSNAFEKCYSLKSVDIPNNVTSIRSMTFYHCTGLTSVIIPNSVRSISTYAFTYCRSLSSITIPNSVTSIGDSAFEGCSVLTSINIPSGVTSISNGVFYGCSSLTSIDIPSGVTSIGNEAFEGCSHLVNLELPSNVTSIGYSAFERCSSLTSITINATTPPNFGDSAFTNTNDCPIYVPCNSINEYKVILPEYSNRIQGIPPCEEPSPITYTRLKTVYNNGTAYSAICNSSTDLTSGETRPNGYVYSAMTSAEIGKCIRHIGVQAFIDCTSLTSITIPNSVRYISKYAFNGCSNLTNVVIPSGVTNIGDYAFAYCTSLTSITILATTPPNFGVDGLYYTKAFNDTNNCPIYVPAASVDAYKSTTELRYYTSRIQAIPT